jgi:uncharacterized protein (TIGR01777 family)
MKVLLAGGRGFLGTALARELRAHGHEVLILTRHQGQPPDMIHWDGSSQGAWSQVIEKADAVVNATGYGLEHWPWSPSRKRRFVESRVLPGQGLATAIQNARHRPQAFLQFSGINYYGLSGPGVADESAPAAGDFLAQLTVQWEAATRVVEQSGVRWIAVRHAIVLDAHGGLLPLMALPLRLFAGGRLGSGKQAVPWIHLGDQVRAVRFLLENTEARGVYNLAAPTPTSSDEFMRAIADVLRRPYWLAVPESALRWVLGEMGDLVLEGRYSRPKRLLDLGFRFEFPTIQLALKDILDIGRLPSEAD